MERIFYLLKQSLFVKLALVATLVIGGGNSVWADDVIVVKGNSINTDIWNTTWGNYTSAWNTSNSNYVQANTWAYYVLVSKSSINMSSHKVVFSARGIGDKAEITIKTSVTGNSTTDAFDVVRSFTKTDLGISSSNEFQSFEVSGIEGSVYMQIFAKGVQIESMDIMEMSTPILSVTPLEDNSFGNLVENGIKTYTVTNVGAGAMDVSITNSNTNDFTISKTSITGLTAGNSETFMVTFNYDADNLGEKNAIITITPSYDESSVITLNVSATAMSDNDPKISVTPSEPADFGVLSAVGTKIYTVTNVGTGNLTVNITSDNDEYFSVSPSVIENITAGASATFTVSFDYVCDLDFFGEYVANITVTPTYNEADAISFAASATATADVVLDENVATTWSSGSGKSVLMKYQPVSGWNTFIIPFATSTYFKTVFGSGARGYKLTKYEDGVLTFAEIGSTYLGANIPILVYVESAPDNSQGVLLKGVYVFQSSSASPGTTNIGNTDYFHGTWIPKTYQSGDEWYGVTSSGQVLQAGEGAYVKGYRAYFTGISAPTDRSRISIVLEGDGTTTDMGFVKMVDKDATDVYTLSGQKVQKAGKGLYIVNGRKVVIK